MWGRGWCWFSVSESTAEVLGTSSGDGGVGRDGQRLNQVLSLFQGPQNQVIVLPVGILLPPTPLDMTVGI